MLARSRYIESLDKCRRKNRNLGWVYILRNSAFREPLLKIGESSRYPIFRARELSAATAIPEGFCVVFFVHVVDRYAAESWVHAWLEPHRKTHNKEFFDVPLPKAIEALERVAEIYPVVSGRGKNRRVQPQLFAPFTTRCPQCGTENRVRWLAIPIVPKCGDCGAPLSVESPRT